MPRMSWFEKVPLLVRALRCGDDRVAKHAVIEFKMMAIAADQFDAVAAEEELELQAAHALAEEASE
jgi:hypothetical protein